MTEQMTASMLYDWVCCPHRVSMDLFADPALKDEVSPFIKLLWERGNAFEKEVMAQTVRTFVDLSGYAGAEKENQTTAAMERKAPLIYAGRISNYAQLGDPDLLRWEGRGYAPIDIKSGSGEEGPEDDAKPKRHYAVQLGLYIDILESKGLSGGREGYIWDVHGQEVLYSFSAPRGSRSTISLWEEYQEVCGQVQAVMSKTETTLPAYSSTCKNCHWYSACLKKVRQDNDLTLIPGLGRSKRDILRTQICTVKELAQEDLSRFSRGTKTCFPGIGVDSLESYQRRARLLSDPGNARPYLKSNLDLPARELEIFFDIEVDPMRDLCYLHGFIERSHQDNATERFMAFYADNPTPEEEAKAFQEAWQYLLTMPQAKIYYYSKYERTLWRKLQKKYPNVCSPEEIEALFHPEKAVDLYFDVVLKHTEWPTNDYSIKTLAKYLGFSWRDTHPSGAASIEWYHRWVESKDISIKQRIIDYNEDDCRATRVLLDGIRGLTVA